MIDLSSLRQAVLGGDAGAAASATRKALDEGAQPVEIISEGIGPAMAEVGRLFEECEFYVPELLMAARATKEIFQILRPLLAQTRVKPTGRVVLGTVQGDLHDIGKNLVAAMLEGGGFEVIDLGVDVPPAKFIAAVQNKQAQIVGLSASALDDDAGDEDHDRGFPRCWYPRGRQDHGRRRAGHTEICGLDWRRWVRGERCGIG